MFLEDGAPMGSRILLVEPEANEREKFRHIIAGTKHELLKDVGCGTEAMGALDEVYPDMVVMSIDTPRSKSDVERAGLKVILKILAKTSPPKVVMSYARGTEMLVVKAIQYGAAGAFERNDSRREVLERCQERVVIPMQEGVDSLNVASASAAVLYEVRRQRSRPS